MKRKYEWSENIPSSQLSEIEIPDVKASVNDLSMFASTFNGYEYAGDLHKCAALSRKIEEGYFDNNNYLSQQSTDDLRCCLFWLYRSNRHASPDIIDDEFMRILIKEIKRRC